MIVFETVAIIVPIVIALVAGAKKMGLQSNLAPLASLVFGVALSFLFMGAGTSAVITGIVAGLSASGLYDQKKITR